MLKKFNKVILLLTLSDAFTWGSFIIIANLAGIYLSTKLGEDTVSFVGIGTSIYFLTRAVLQMPIGHLTDKIKNDKDEIILLVLGILFMGLPYIFYPLITRTFQYYVLQFIFGLGVSLNLPNWRKLFALNLDQGQEGFQYGFYETILSISTAIFSIVVGYIANLGDSYFDISMRAVGIIMMLSSIWVLLIFKVKKRKSDNENKKIIAVENVSK
jgi:MFS family permease